MGGGWGAFAASDLTTPTQFNMVFSFLHNSLNLCVLCEWAMHGVVLNTTPLTLLSQLNAAYVLPLFCM